MHDLKFYWLAASLTLHSKEGEERGQLSSDEELCSFVNFWWCLYNTFRICSPSSLRFFLGVNCEGPCFLFHWVWTILPFRRTLQWANLVALFGDYQYDIRKKVRKSCYCSTEKHLQLVLSLCYVHHPILNVILAFLLSGEWWSMTQSKNHTTPHPQFNSAKSNVGWACTSITTGLSEEAHLADKVRRRRRRLSGHLEKQLSFSTFSASLSRLVSIFFILKGMSIVQLWYAFDHWLYPTFINKWSLRLLSLS